MKLLYSSIVLILCAVIVVLFFSEKKSYYQCEGTLGEEPATAYFKLSEYRWWVLSRSMYGNGHLNLEIPRNPGTIADYFIIRRNEADDILLFNIDNKFRGIFSSVSDNVEISLSPTSSFNGPCKRIEGKSD